MCVGVDVDVRGCIQYLCLCVSVHGCLIRCVGVGVHVCAYSVVRCVRVGVGVYTTRTNERGC